MKPEPWTFWEHQAKHLKFSYLTDIFNHVNYVFI